MVIFTSIEYVASAYYCLYSIFFFSSLNSFNSSRGICYLDYASGSFTLFDCNWFSDLSLEAGESLILIIGTYLGICNSWFDIDFFRRNIPKNSFSDNDRNDRPARLPALCCEHFYERCLIFLQFFYFLKYSH